MPSESPRRMKGTRFGLAAFASPNNRCFDSRALPCASCKGWTHSLVVLLWTAAFGASVLFAGLTMWHDPGGLVQNSTMRPVTIGPKVCLSWPRII